MYGGDGAALKFRPVPHIRQSINKTQQKLQKIKTSKNFNQKLKISKSVTLTTRSLMWVKMVQHKTSDQYLTSGKVSTRSIHGFKRYRLLKTLTKN